jgi:formylglycine-generating enzyme required for sulfatase activity
LETPTLPITPTPGIGSTQVSDADGMLMVYVPAGDFTMGSNEGDPTERPVHMVYLEAFWIDRTEITNAMFARFADATGHRTDAERLGWSWDYNSSGWNKTSGADWRHPSGPGSSLNGLENHPVLRVSWNDAVAYCAWAGRRLPSEAEWEKAARGTDARIFPWGNSSPSAALLNFDDTIGRTTPVGNYPDGASPYGAWDMAGNVWEWVQDWYQEDYYRLSPASDPTGPLSGEGHGMRGGAWGVEAGRTSTTFREWGYTDNAYWSTGFRCATDATP